MDDRRVTEALRWASDTRRIVVADGALDLAGEVFRECFGEQSAVIVADDNTFAAAGSAVQQRLSGSSLRVEPPIVFPGLPLLYADYRNVVLLEERLRGLDAVPVAVGSGTINDLTKLAAHRAGRAYMVVATAASMDGYTAFGSAITRDGFKQTMSCPAPRAVVADPDILANAPPGMNSSGYGDLLGKVTAGADWLLADALEIEPVEPAAWALVQDRLREWTARPHLVRAGDRQAVGRLFEGLTMSGVAMQITGSSRPASGSEHRFSHLWEMQALARGEPVVPHGFKVGMGTIASTLLYERLLARDLGALDIDRLCREWPSREQAERLARAAHDSPRLAENAAEETLAKYIDAAQLRERLTLLGERWPLIRARLREQLVPAERLAALLREAGCPTTPAAIGLDSGRVMSSYEPARTIRRRYTVLDLAAESGLLAECLAEIFSLGGYWERLEGPDQAR